MSRSLAALFVFLALASCSLVQPTQVVEEATPEIVSHAPVQRWLGLHQRVAGMSDEELSVKLATLDKPNNANQLFYFALLHNQGHTYGGWTQARDSFRQLLEEKSLTEAQRQLASIFQMFNQSRINGYQREDKLQLDLLESEQNKLLLEQKIQAITDVETVMSTRGEK
jgi:hypothetical protein